MAERSNGSEGVRISTMVVSMVLVFGAGLFIGRAFLARKSKKCSCPKPPKEVVRYRIYPRPSAPTLGPRNAKVTIIEVTDLMCPECREAAKLLVSFQKAHPKDVRLVFTVNPVSAPARLLAAAVEAANKQERFWEFHNALIALNPRMIQEKHVIAAAKKAGLNMQEFLKVYKAPTTSRSVMFQSRILTRLGVKEMPAVFLNGRYLHGKITRKQLETILAEEIRAYDRVLDKLRKQGRIRPGREALSVYRELLRDARRSLQTARSDKQAPKREDPNAVYRVPVADKPWKGTEHALVTIVEFSDFQCPYCHRVNATLAQVLAAYKGKVKIVWHNNPLPFHKNALLAAEAAWEVYKQKGREAFWKYHDLLFGNQARLAKEGRAFLEEAAEQVGVDMGRFRKALDEHTHLKEIQAQVSLGKNLAVKGTPTFFINGRKLRGAQDFATFKLKIDQAIKEADAAIKAGKATPETYYDLVLKRGLSHIKYLEKRPAVRRHIVDPNVTYRMPIQGKPWKGTKHALVTIVESSDFQCPYCRKVEPILARLMEEYKGKIKIVWHNNPLPFHRNAMIAAEAAWEVYKQKGSAAFWKYETKLYENQARLNREGRAFLEEAAKELGVDMARFRKALDTHVHRKEMADQRALSQRLGARGTPGFFINGKIFIGARPYRAFKAIVDRELARAEKIAAKVGGPAKVYDHLMKHAKDAAVYKDQTPPPQGPKPAPIRIRPSKALSRPTQAKK